MKTKMIQLTAGTFFALLLLVGNVRAQGAELKATCRKNIEPTAQLENRMSDATILNTNTINIDEFTQETELALELKNWMTSEEIWNLNNNIYDETEEEPLNIEDWMISDEIWNTVSLDVEPALTVKDWMINDNYWK